MIDEEDLCNLHANLFDLSYSNLALFYDKHYAYGKEPNYIPSDVHFPGNRIL